MKTTYARQIVEDFYFDEDSENSHEAFNMKITVSGQISDITMLDAIAARFNTTRSSIVSDLLHSSVLEMYFGLSKVDREALSKSADSETSRILEKKGVKQKFCGFGVTDTGESQTGDCTWRSYDNLMLKNEQEKENDNS